MNLKKLFNSKGFTLIELLVSFVILSIFLGVVGSALQNSFVQNSSADNKLNSIYVGKNTLKYFQDQSYECIERLLENSNTDGMCPNPEIVSIPGMEVNLDNIMTLPQKEKDKLNHYKVTADFNRYQGKPDDPTDNSLSDKLIEISVRVTASVNSKEKDYEIKGYKRNEAQQ